MIDLPPCRIVDGDPMLLVGLRRHHRFADANTTVPAQWQEFRSLPHFATRAPRAFGVMCGATDDSFEYMTAIEVASFDDAPADLGRMRVPAQRYAVFAHDGHVSDLPWLWRTLWEEWLPNSDYVDGNTPAFELYGPRFDPGTGLGGYEVWFPVAPK